MKAEGERAAALQSSFEEVPSSGHSVRPPSGRSIDKRGLLAVPRTQQPSVVITGGAGSDVG